MKLIICAVCGGVKPANKMGDGINVPKTTCLECYRSRQASNKAAKERDKERESS